MSLRWWYLILAIPVIGILAFATLKPIRVLPRRTLAPGMILTDQNGNRLTNEDLRGKFVLYNFSYSNCNGTCPETMNAMREVQNHLGEMPAGSPPVALVTISFDPQRDTTEQLKAWAQRVGANDSQWRLATGDETLLKYIIGDGFETYYKQNADDTFTYEPHFVLVDGWGIVRAIYPTGTPGADLVMRDLKLLAEEATNSQGAARYAYEAAHLFACYP
jgi:protein SCO1